MTWERSLIYSVVQSRTDIPIPSIIDWSDDPSNSIGVEYIITEHVSGVQLHEVWNDMNFDQQVKFISRFCEMIAPLANTEFPAYRSLYFADAPLSPFSTVPFDHEFVIGPHVEREAMAAIASSSQEQASNR